MPILETRWLACSMALFGLTGILFVAGALPLQRRIEHLLEDVGAEDEGGAEDENGDDWWDAYRRLARRWLAVAGTSFVLTVGILYLMIH